MAGRLRPSALNVIGRHSTLHGSVTVGMIVRPRYNLSVFLSSVYLATVLLVPAWHAVELAGRSLPGSGDCARCSSSGPVLDAPCSPTAPCTNPHHHHHRGQHHNPGPCPRCTGALGPALGGEGGAAAAVLELEQPVPARVDVLLSVTLADVKAPRAPPRKV